MDSNHYLAANKFLLMHVPPVLLLLGTFGNIFSFIILAKNMFKVSTYSYLAVLAIMDMLVLYIGLLRLWLSNFSLDILLLSDSMCKVVNFLAFVSSDTSVWLIIAVTVERFIAVNFPLRAPRMCNARRARYVIFCVVSAFFATNAHIMWTVELRHDTINGKTIVCDAADGFEILVQDVWPWVDAALYSFVPFVTITILNCLIIYQVLKARKRRTKLQHAQACSSSVGLLCQSQAKKTNESSKKLTCMLLAVSFTFLLTTLPMNTFTIVSAFMDDQFKKEYIIELNLARTVVELLMYINHSINFYLYCATGRKFRKQFKVMLCHCCSKKPAALFKDRKHVTTTTTSFHLTRMNSRSSPRSLVVECDRRFILANSSR